MKSGSDADAQLPFGHAAPNFEPVLVDPPVPPPEYEELALVLAELEEDTEAVQDAEVVAAYPSALSLVVVDAVTATAATSLSIVTDVILAVGLHVTTADVYVADAVAGTVVEDADRLDPRTRHIDPSAFRRIRPCFLVVRFFS